MSSFIDRGISIRPPDGLDPLSHVRAEELRTKIITTDQEQFDAAIGALGAEVKAYLGQRACELVDLGIMPEFTEILDDSIWDDPTTSTRLGLVVFVSYDDESIHTSESVILAPDGTLYHALPRTNGMGEISGFDTEWSGELTPAEYVQHAQHAMDAMVQVLDDKTGRTAARNREEKKRQADQSFQTLLDDEKRYSEIKDFRDRPNDEAGTLANEIAGIMRGLVEMSAHPDSPITPEQMHNVLNHIFLAQEFDGYTGSKNDFHQWRGAIEVGFSAGVILSSISPRHAEITHALGKDMYTTNGSALYRLRRSLMVRPHNVSENPRAYEALGRYGAVRDEKADPPRTPATYEEFIILDLHDKIGDDEMSMTIAELADWLLNTPVNFPNTNGPLYT